MQTRHLLLAGAALLSLACRSQSHAPRAPQLTVLHTGANTGEIEPCG